MTPSAGEAKAVGPAEQAVIEDWKNGITPPTSHQRLRNQTQKWATPTAHGRESSTNRQGGQSLASQVTQDGQRPPHATTDPVDIRPTETDTRRACPQPSSIMIPSGEKTLWPTPTASCNPPAKWKPGVIWWMQSRAARNLWAIALIHQLRK